MEDLSKLKWRCRRGTLELDILFQRYLDSAYLQADQGERQSFLQLQALEDSELMRYLMGSLMPESDHLARLVHKMRHLVDD